MYLPYYNITWKNKEFEYSYFLYVLVRKFWFSCKIKREDFIKTWIQNGFKKTVLYKYWNLWAYKNQFFRWVDNDTIYLSSKKTFELVCEKVPKYMLDKIINISSFKLFLHTVFLWRSWYTNKDWQQTWIWINKIAKIHNTSNRTVLNRNEKAKSKFSLEIEKRFYKTEDNYICKATNKYSAWIRVIKNKYCKVNIKPFKLVKGFVMPLFIDLDDKIQSLYKKCKDRVWFAMFYWSKNQQIYNWIIKRNYLIRI